MIPSVVITLPSYCERIASGGEVLNLLSNAAFVLAAFLAWRGVGQEFLPHRVYLKSLAVLLALIGLGSAYFHVAPSEFSILFDAIPIYLFIALALGLLYRLLTGGWAFAWGVGLLLAVFFAGTFALAPPAFLNGSVRHLGVLSFLLVTAGLCYRTYGREALSLLVVLGLYLAGIVLRSVDQAVCGGFPVGTHFLWHLLSAAAGYAAIAFIIRLDRPKGLAAPSERRMSSR